MFLRMMLVIVLAVAMFLLSVADAEAGCGLFGRLREKRSQAHAQHCQPQAAQPAAVSQVSQPLAIQSAFSQVAFSQPQVTQTPVAFPTPLRSGFYDLTGYPLGGCAGGQCPKPTPRK